MRESALMDRHGFDGRPYYLNGTQSLVRLFQLEKRRRSSQGRKTAVYVTGYRGSPLGTLDQAFERAADQLDPDIRLATAVNEDLAATAVWGTQQVGTFGAGRFEGVSAAWYGKGPGVDRTGDVFKHGNLAGSSREGGVIVIAGDDHVCKSSTTAHQSEFAFVDAMIPVLAPASIAEQMAYGLIGWELSRFSGLWAGLKVVTEIMDSSESLAGDPVFEPVVPDDVPIPRDGVWLRWPDTALAQEERLHQFKIPAALAFARANRLDRRIFGRRGDRLGIVTVGKAHADAMHALADLGLDGQAAATIGLGLYKVAMPWPLEPAGLRDFAAGLDHLIVVEEKRGLVEDQIRSHLYGTANAPEIVGKRDPLGDWLLPSNGELGADAIAVVLGRWLAERGAGAELAERSREIARRLEKLRSAASLAHRPPHFCPGCPHNSSTKLPAGSRAFAGIGCGFLAQGMERETAGFTHMGGEGANWIGLAPYSTTRHMFQNLGDGTYFHSGSLAVRAAVAAGVNVTYKILFNDAVAMTGGQPVDGELTVESLCAQLIAEGVRRVAVVSDEPGREKRGSLPAGVAVHPREELDEVQRRLRDIEGVTALVYHQTCATELRRLRKRGKLPAKDVAVVINQLVCEGCGDCSRSSNCLAVVPVDTEFGRKRAVDHSTCNQDQTCLDGFCPSFVTVEGGRRRAPQAPETGGNPLPEPARTGASASILVAGVGGTGVVTIGAILGMAAHLDGKAVRVMDMTGLAQKGGAVVSHIRIAPAGTQFGSAKIGAGRADLLLACDLVVAGVADNLGRVASNGHIVANNHEIATSAFTRDPEFALPMSPLAAAAAAAVGPGQAAFCDATNLAKRLVGDPVGGNLFLVGFAWQRGLIPLSLEAIERAIAVNGVAVELNRRAFDWGRRAAIDLPAVTRAAFGGDAPPAPETVALDDFIARRISFLTDYQDAAYAERYRDVIERTREAERAIVPGGEALTRTVATTLFRLMAYKDEYEVARLYTQTGFLESVAAQFEGHLRLRFHLAPPLFPGRDKATGRPRKRRFGRWAIFLFRLLAKARRLRGTPFDPFGYARERRTERRLIEAYRRLIAEELLPKLDSANFEAALELASADQAIRGFGPVKADNIERAEATRNRALAEFGRAGSTQSRNSAARATAAS